MGIFNKIFDKKKSDRNHMESTDPIFIDNELGYFSLDRESNCFQGKIDWMDSKCDVQLRIEPGETEIAQGVVDILIKLHNYANEWDLKVRKFAAKKLTELANDWQSDIDIDSKEITKEEFEKRISLYAICIDADGELEFYFDDGDMFAGHTIIVYGNISGELECAEIGG